MVRAPIPPIRIRLPITRDERAPLSRARIHDQIRATHVLGAELALAVPPRVAVIGLALVVLAIGAHDTATRIAIEVLLPVRTARQPTLVRSAHHDGRIGNAVGGAVRRPARAVVAVAAGAGAVDGVVVHAVGAAGRLAQAVAVAEVVGAAGLGRVALHGQDAPGRVARVVLAAVTVPLLGRAAVRDAAAMVAAVGAVRVRRSEEPAEVLARGLRACVCGGGMREKEVGELNYETDYLMPLLSGVER